MRELRFCLYICGVSEETFTEQIMIYKPIHTVVSAFSQRDLEERGITCVSGLIGWIKRDRGMREALGEWGLENLGTETVYLRHREYLLGFREDKALSELFDTFSPEILELAYFITGGASIHNETSYRFTIHPREEIHRYQPHVHVSKDQVEIRYSLETLQPMDPLVYPHRRDQKKIILPFLRKNRERLLELWNLYLEGYAPPVMTQEGRQFYKES